jgi:hypothetical protein
MALLPRHGHPPVHPGRCSGYSTSSSAKIKHQKPKPFLYAPARCLDSILLPADSTSSYREKIRALVRAHRWEQLLETIADPHSSVECGSACEVLRRSGGALLSCPPLLRLQSKMLAGSLRAT